MSKPVPTFYVFHGDDELTLAETVAELRQRLEGSGMADLNTAVLDGQKVTLTELRNACEAIPFLSDRRLVIVEGLLSRLQQRGERFLKGLLALPPRLPETTRLIFVEDRALPDDHPVLQLARRHPRGYVRRFDPPQPGELPRWITQRARRHGGRIAPQAAARLAETIGADLRLLDQEIRKLVTYVGSEREIGVEDVALLVPYVRQAVVFDLVDALGHRDGRTAASTLQRLLDGGEHPMGILAMIVRQFRLLIQVAELRRAGENSASIARILGLHPYPARKLYAQSANFTLAQLEQIYRHLLATDAEIKQGSLTPEIALDLLVAGLTGRSGPR